MLVHHICLLVGDLIITSLFKTPASSTAWHILLQHVEHLQQTFLTAVKVCVLDLMTSTSQ